MEIHFSGKCDVMRGELYHRLPFDPDNASKTYRRLDRGRIKVQLKIAKVNPRRRCLIEKENHTPVSYEAPL